MYGKIFSQIYDGSLYGRWEALVTFQQMIVLAGSDGILDMTQEALAARTSIPLDIIERGIAHLEEDDPRSRTPDEDGRRIVRLDFRRDWGWQITNHAHYRAMRTAEERREYFREHKRKSRAAAVDGLSTSVHKSPQSPPIAVRSKQEAEAELLDNDNNGANPSKSGNVEKSPPIVEKFAAEDREVIEAVRRSVRIPAAFDGAVRGLIEGSGGPAFPAAVVGRAIAEMAAAGVPFRPASLRAFCRRLVDDAASEAADGAAGAGNGARRGGKGVPAASDQWGRVVARLAAKDAAEAAERAARRARGEAEEAVPDYSEFEVDANAEGGR